MPAHGGAASSPWPFACVLLAWSAGPARAAWALDGVATATPAVTKQAPAPGTVGVPAPADAAVQVATTSLRHAGEPVHKVARPAVAAPQAAVAAAPVPNTPVATEPRPGPAVSTAPVLKRGADAVSTAPVLNGGADASTQPGDAAAHETAGKAASGHARATAASAAADRDADHRKQPTAGGFAGLGAAAWIPATTGVPQLVQLGSDKTQSVTASGWRNRTPAAGTHRPQGGPGATPLGGSGGATSVAAASSAAASAAGLLGLLLLLTFAAQRLGALVRLQPDWAPPAPFVALPERPG